VQSSDGVRAASKQPRYAHKEIVRDTSGERFRNEDEAALWERYRNKGDQAAREALVVKYLRLAKYLAGRAMICLPQEIDERDVMGWAVVGLLEAVEKYDPAQKVSFSTFASHRIRGEILDSVRDLDWLPRVQRRGVKKVTGAAEKLRASLGREPRPEEIGDEIGMAVEDVLDNLSKVVGTTLLSLDQPLGDDSADDESEMTLESVVKDPAESPLEIADKTEKLEMLAQAIPKLNDSQQKVLYLYYNKGLTLKEVAKVLDVTEGRVCQLHRDAIKKLRVKMARWITE
jgi:RNA polymerase sigma factor for flagellar operon FliA